MKYKHILALDPSGSFHEGKGTTGWCVLDAQTIQVLKTGFIAAKDFPGMEDYWGDHLLLIKQLCTEDTIVVIEDYLLYESKLDTQINSRMETPKLIGLLQYSLWEKHIPYYMQTAVEVKKRWADNILIHKGIFIPKGNGVCLPIDTSKLINRHCKDSVRHAVHYATFRNKEN